MVSIQNNVKVTYLIIVYIISSQYLKRHSNIICAFIYMAGDEIYISAIGQGLKPRCHYACLLFRVYVPLTEPRPYLTTYETTLYNNIQTI